MFVVGLATFGLATYLVTKSLEEIRDELRRLNAMKD